MLLAALALLAQLRAASHDPAYSATGSLALSIRGDLWLLSPDGRWSQLTSGPATDREPAWSPDRRAILFASDRDGRFGIWRIALGADGSAAGEPTRLVGTADGEREPVAAPEGRTLFVRGRGAAARLWVRDADGTERRLTRGRTAERWPALSRDGRRLAYVALGERGAQLRVRVLDSDTDSLVASVAGAEHPAWSPAGDRLTFTVGGARAGVFVTDLAGRYTNLVSARHAASAWSPDGARLALVELPDDDVSYNGDPDRLGDRDARNLLARGGRLWLVDAPAAPDSGRVAASPPVVDRAGFNAAAFDEAWARTARLYYEGRPARRAAWEALRARDRPRALAAAGDDELRQVLHEMWRDRERPPYREPASGRAAVSSAHPVATEAGLEILRRGGNVVDAAVAVSFALGVVEPDASGVGGYGQMLVYRAGMPAPQLIEFMSRVPEDASLGNADLLQNGRLPDDGPVLANVPGTVAAMHLAWRRHGSGRVPWPELLAPAIRAARDGYVVSEGLATTLATEREHFLKYPASRALFFRDGQPLHAGDTLRNPDLASTLAQIASGGADAFYRGDVARRLVADLRGQGNAMKLADLARYFAAEREPVSGTYRGYTVFSSAPPVSGGASLVATLNLLEQSRDLRPWADDASSLHAMLSAWMLVPSARNRIADPGLWPVDVAPFTNKDSARARWRCFDPAHALAPSAFRGDSLVCSRGSGVGSRVSHASPLPTPDTRLPDLAPCPGHDHGDAAAIAPAVCHAAGTTAFTVADADGNVVAVTQTLGTWGGNFYVTPGLGFLYNDKLASYGGDPGAYGARLPYARHGSTIAPTIVFQAGRGGAPRPVYALGAAGNAWITAAVYQTLVALVDLKLDPQTALEQPRFLIGGVRGGADGGDGVAVQMEDGVAPAVLARLEQLGYRTQLVSVPGELREGYGAAVAIGRGRVTAGADPRRSGAAGAIP